MSQKVYWKGLDELHETQDFKRNRDNEFPENLPIEEFLSSDTANKSGTGRRDFLKFLGFSVTAAAVAACEAPINKALPYVIKPENLTPGIPNYYTSTFFDDNDYASILVKTREGRPILIESSNPQANMHNGVSAKVSASVLGLYDTKRLKEPTKAGAAISWEDADKEISAALAGIAGEGKSTVILSGTIISPSTKKAIADLQAKYANISHVTYDAISYSAIGEANAAVFGKNVIPTYRFDNALSVASFGADFLGTWLDHSSYETQFAKNRNPKGKMSRLFAFEPIMSLTGANADYRTSIKHSEIGVALVHLYNALSGNKLPAADITFGDKIKVCAQHLLKNKGNALVVCGLNDVNAQIITAEINKILGAYPSTVDNTTACYLKQGDNAKVNEVLKQLGTNVQGLILYNANPVYNHPEGEKIKSALAALKLSVSFANGNDESAEACKYVLPDHHYLESWNDFNPCDGFYSLSQPTIHPLFNTRQAQESFLVWAGVASRGDKNNTNYREYIKSYWSTNLYGKQSKYTSFDEFWNYTVHDGCFSTSKDVVVENLANTTKKGSSKAHSDDHGISFGSDIEPNNANHQNNDAPQDVAVAVSSNINDAAAKLNELAKSSKGIEVVLYQKVGIGSGNQANNPWLQEFPDPISKITWDNYITMSPEEMKAQGFGTYIGQEDPADVAKVTVNGKTIELPVVASPGQKAGTIGIALGYGRKFGKGDEVIGKNAYIFNTAIGAAYGASVEKTGTQYALASTQTHGTMMGRDIVKETSLSQYHENPTSGNHKHSFHTQIKQLKGEAIHGHLSADQADYWKKFDRPNHNWGLTIDLNSCTGCGACVIACHAENNVAVVGKDEIRRVREMHWLRIDRYYSSDMTLEKAHEEHLGAIEKYAKMEVPSENPQVVFQPVMCQHCSQAPCETVCPVLATTHSNEGLNQMTYNRCIGTRYCANNCPYKVRRFNWFKYFDNDQFDFYMNDDLGKMVLNPDVTVRSRGVMEKCSMCVQRIQYGKLEAKKDKRRPQDGEIKTACQSACPTNAITFGDYNDELSLVHQIRSDERSYALLEEVGTEPNVFYQVKVRNVDEKYHHHQTAAHKEKSHEGAEHGEKHGNEHH